jgi:putative ABC transport system substrate-binding protein
LSSLVPEISGKQLDLLKEIVPKTSPVAILWASSNPANAQALKDVERAAAVSGIKLQALDVLKSQNLEPAFRAATNNRADAFLVMQNAVAIANRSEIAQLAIKSRLPAIYPRSAFVDSGGLLSYGASFSDMDRRAAVYVDKILQGAKPADLPVEQPTKFDPVINLKTAKQTGSTIPPNVLARADNVIR